MVYYPEAKPTSLGMSSYFDRKQIGTLDVLGTTLEDTIYYNPISATGRFIEQTGQEVFGRGKLLSKEEYEESEYFREGIQVGDEGIKEGVAKILAERKDKRDVINFELSRSPGGFGLGAAQFGTALFGSLLDPINIAASFIPVVGQARLAQLTARAGQTGARAVTGVAEGAVGAALVEPIVYGQARMEYDQDYTMMDSLLNVAIGGVLGGGLHVGFGKISDRINATKQKQRADAISVALSQTLADQEVDVVKLHEDSAKRAREQVEERAQAAREYAEGVRSRETFVDPETGEVKIREEVMEGRVPPYDQTPDLDRKGRGRPPMLRVSKPMTLLQFIRKEGGVSTKDPNAADIKQFADKDLTILRKDGKSLEDLITRAREEGYIDEAPVDAPDDFGVNDFVNLIQQDKLSGEVFSRIDDAEVAAYRNAESLKEQAESYGIDVYGLSDDEFMKAITSKLEIDEYTQLVSRPPEGVNVASEEEFAAMIDEARAKDYDLGAMSDYSDFLNRIDESGASLKVKEINELNAETDALQLDVNRLIEQDFLPQEVVAYLDEADELVEKSEDFYRQLTRSAASCVIGKGSV